MQVTKEYARSVYDALMLCFEMWDELAGMESAKRGMGNVRDKYRTHAFKLTSIVCAACSHKTNNYPSSYSCKKRCIMIELWPKMCLHFDSPYFSWSIGKGTSSDARKIADFAKNKAKRIAKKWGFE